MNAKQKKLLLYGIYLAVGMILVPPWTSTLDIPGSIHRENFEGYGLLFAPPDAGAGGISVDLKVLAAQFVALAAIVATGCFYLKDAAKTKPNAEEPET